MSNLENYSGIDFTKLLLFGTNNVPSDFNERVRAENGQGVEVVLDADQFMAVGPGRFAWPSRANIVEDFFQDDVLFGQLAPGDYSLQELKQEIESLTGEPVNDGDTYIPIDNYGTRQNSPVLNVIEN